MTLAAHTAEAGGRLSGLVLDLRDNNGGLFKTAIAVAQALLPAGAPVVTLENRGTLGRTATAEGGSLPADVPIVVVVNDRTAAGAELVAEALRDSRALLLGSRTFGDATVQTLIKLPKRIGASVTKNYIRLTTGRMLPPAGPSWQRRGLVPDLPAQSVPNVEGLEREDSLPGALPTGPETGAPRSGAPSINPLRDRLARIAPLVLPAPGPIDVPGPSDVIVDFEIEQALRVLSLLRTPSVIQ